MKTVTRFFPLMITLFVVSLAGDVQGQGKGHHKGDKRKHGGHHHKNAYHWMDDHDYERHHHARRPAHVVHYHDRYCHHAPVVVHHQPRPRYVYYRDYDVYYDTHNSVYISYAGRNWAVTASLPVALQHVDVYRTVTVEVDYHEDDLPRYLETSRPVVRRIYTGR